MDEYLQVFNEVTLMSPSIGAIVAGICACLLLFVSSFASGSEIAFFSLSPSDLNELDEEKTTGDVQIKQLRNDSERTLATILITNNLVNVTIIMLSTYFFSHTVNFGSSWWLQFTCMTVLLTFLLLLFGEIMPKVYCGQHALSFCRRAVGGILFCRKIFYPIATIVMGSFKASFQEVMQCVVENNYSRIPVYQDNSDNVRGILYIKDLLPHLSKGNNFRWQSLIRPPYFVPETKKIDDLLREFQENKVHIAIVVDEFGGTSGIVTLEDILEEIVGEINDEYDDDEKSYVRINNNTFVFEGKTLLSDFYKILKLDDDIFEEVEGDADTLAGLLLEIKGDFPKLHEKIAYQDFTFEILAMEERRISKVKVVVNEKAAE